MRSQVSALESAVAAASAAVTAGSPTAPTLTPSCLKSVACCKLTIAKTASASANPAATEQACNGIGLLPDDVCAKQYEGQKRAAAMIGAICP
jgi:hypothetical protein